MFLVVSFTPDFTPPKTPAIHIGSSALQIIKSSAESVLSIPSKVLKTVPSGHFFTITLLPIISSASKACKGCPKSCNT